MSQDPTEQPMGETSAPGVVQAIPVETAVQQGESPGEETITEPAKLLRIATMVRELLEETRQTSLDEPGRKRLADIYGRSVGELSEVLSEDLREELSSLAPSMEGVPTESELRVAQAQLVGWLEGLFHGIQAAMFAQQASARAQFDELRRRGLLAQNPQPEHGQEQEPPPRGGQYL
jgi:Bacterial proteasome activator